jgi:hypothetical protein
MDLVLRAWSELRNETLDYLYTTLNNFGIKLLWDMWSRCKAVQPFGTQPLGEEITGKTSAVNTSQPNSCAGLHLLHTSHNNMILKLLSMCTNYKVNNLVSFSTHLTLNPFKIQMSSLDPHLNTHKHKQFKIFCKEKKITLLIKHRLLVRGTWCKAFEVGDYSIILENFCTYGYGLLFTENQKCLISWPCE